MKLRPSIYLDKCSSKLHVPSILSLDILFHDSLTLQIFVKFYRLGHFLRDFKGWSHETGHGNVVMSVAQSYHDLFFYCSLTLQIFVKFLCLGHFLKLYGLEP